MALKIIDTKDAKYYLGLGRHDQSSAPIFEGVDFSGLDFFVFEDCGKDSFLTNRINTSLQYSDIYQRIVNENPSLGIYGVDVDSPSLPDWALALSGGALFSLGAYSTLDLVTNRKMSRRRFLGNCLSLFGATLPSNFIALTFNSGEEEKLPLSTQYNSFLSNVFPAPGVSFRDAVTAKKVSEYLVPKYKEFTGKNKIECAMIYGIGHSGIETKLNNPWISNLTLSAYDNLSIVSRKDLNEVRQVVSEGFGKRRTIYSDCGLFR